LARQELRELHSEVLANKSEATSTRSGYLGKVLDKANGLFEVTKSDGRGAALDASLLSTTSMLGAEQAGNLEKITPEKYISRLRAKFGFTSGNSSKIKWQELAQAVADAQIFDLAPAATFVDGRFEAPEKKTKQKREKRARDEPEGPVQVAQSVDVGALQENDTGKAQVVRMKVLAKTIKKVAVDSKAAGGPERACLFQTLLHPTSFSQTVENFFDLAFLVKQGNARVTSDSGGLYLSTAKPPVTDDFSKGDAAATQNILKLDHPTYKRLVARWFADGRKPHLPEREAGSSSSSANAGGSSGGDAGGSSDAPPAAAKKQSKKARSS